MLIDSYQPKQPQDSEETLSNRSSRYPQKVSSRHEKPGVDTIKEVHPVVKVRQR